MPATQPSHFVDGRPMLLGGVRRTHAYADAARGIPAQWTDFAAMGPLPGQRAGVTYGVLCGHDAAARTMEYMCAVEVAALDALPPGVGRVRVPAQRYAVFAHDGPIAGIRGAWDAVWAWLAASEYRSAERPDFERYDGRYDPRTGSGVVELWIGVEPEA